MPGSPEAQTAFGDRLGSVAFAGALCIAALCAAASLSWPYGWDQGIYSWTADVIVRGGVMFRDAFDNKGPAAPYAYAVLRSVFGTAMWSVRVADLVALLVGAAGIYFITADLTGRAAARWCALVLVLWIESMGYWDTAQPDEWFSILLAASFAVLIRYRSGTHRIVASVAGGVVIAAGTLLKPFYLSFLLIPVAIVYLHSGAGPSWRVSVAWIGAGLSLTLVAVLLWFARHGALDDMIDAVWRYNVTRYSGIDALNVVRRMEGVLKFAGTGPLIAVSLPLLCAGAASLWHEKKNDVCILLLWLAIAVGCVVLQGKFFPYQWIIVYPPLAVLGVAGARAFRDVALLEAQTQPRRRVMRTLWLVTVGTAMSHAVLSPTLSVERWMKYLFGLSSTSEYYAGFRFGTWTYRAGDDLVAAEYIAAHSEPRDEVAVYGWNASILSLSHRSSPSRFGFSAPLDAGGDSPHRTAYRNEYLAALRQRPPLFFVAGTPHGAPDLLCPADGMVKLQRFPQLAAWVANGYALMETIGCLHVYRRRTLPG